MTSRSAAAARGRAAVFSVSIAVSAFQFGGVAGATTERPPGGKQESALPTASASPVLDVTAMNRSVDACDDLYTYACGGWQAANPIPPDRAVWNVYSKLQLDTHHLLRSILEEAARPTERSSSQLRQLGDYYAACMDLATIEGAGKTPIESDLARIDGLRDKAEIAPLLADLHMRTSTSGLLFASAVAPDANDSTRMIADLDAGGIGLPDRDYYVSDDADTAPIRERYSAHVAGMFALFGDDDVTAVRHAAIVLRVESTLAHASLDNVARREPMNVHHRTPPGALAELAPTFDWVAYYRAAGLNPAPWLNVAEPAFIKAVGAVLAHEPLDDLKVYLKWGLIDATAPYLSSAYVEESFAFYHAYLFGEEVDRPRWQKCVEWADRDMGDALGREYVARTFSRGTKEQVVVMVGQIETAMRRRIEQLDWMASQTKAEALAKLAMVQNKIGYPEVWRDYGDVSIVRRDFYGNVARATAFESHRQAAKIGQPIDRREWSETTPTVNAFYDQQLNEMFFPAGVLMPPLYQLTADAAPNYGNTGSTIGHELTHAFDDEGRRYDRNGNLRDWWTARDATRFDARAQCVRDQYAQYIVVDDTPINASLTSGEDIADLGGTLLAWAAWREQTKGLKLELKQGLTPEQRFFVGLAQWACQNVRPEWLRANAISGVHSPVQHRVNGVVANMPEFASAFGCRPGHKLVKPLEQVCRLW